MGRDEGRGRLNEQRRSLCGGLERRGSDSSDDGQDGERQENRLEHRLLHARCSKRDAFARVRTGRVAGHGSRVKTEGRYGPLESRGEERESMNRNSFYLSTLGRLFLI